MDPDKWVFILCKCGSIFRRLDGFKRHKKTGLEGDHEVRGKMYRCVSLLCVDTLRLYKDWVAFKENHKMCLFHSTFEKDPCKKTRMVFTKKLSEEPDFLRANPGEESPKPAADGEEKLPVKRASEEEASPPMMVERVIEQGNDHLSCVIIYPSYLLLSYFPEATASTRGRYRVILCQIVVDTEGKSKTAILNELFCDNEPSSV